MLTTKQKSLANFKQATAAVPEAEPTDLSHTQQTQTKAHARNHSHRHRHGEITPPTSADDSPLPVPERTSSHASPRRGGGNLPTTETRGHFEYPTSSSPSATGITSTLQQQQQQHHQPKKRKSFVSTIFSRSSSRAERREDGVRATTLPTILSDRSL